jgi:hypothetical protein
MHGQVSKYLENKFRLTVVNFYTELANQIKL